ncbi:uncharacterized protein LOC124315952 [Daphnia pulicaria]|uniref:uncharacterized protein LOC124315952 n=1 Tax=Daphnia pulicaria TaxID=35523 RepID=UPI001EEB58DF|nr:uncharacterized protein LOC124315952 [Daphnia pulicaria]
MYKIVLLLLALAAIVFAMETQDQESAEQYYRIHGVYPSWYPYGAVRAFGSYPYGYNYGAYPFGVRNYYGAVVATATQPEPRTQIHSYPGCSCSPYCGQASNPESRPECCEYGSCRPTPPPPKA